MVFRAIRHRAAVSYFRTWDFGHFFVGHLRRLRGYARRSWAGADPASDSTYHAVYVHFDTEGVVHDYVIEQLRQLVAARFRITILSNSPRLHMPSIECIKPLCRRVIWRRNVGYDFGAYKDGIANVGDLSACDRLLLMNDSVYGPFRPFTEVFRAIDPDKADIWGITDSWDGHYHIQTYFILFCKNALSSPIFQKFWRQLPYVNSKHWIIRNAEMQLTRKLTKHKFRAAALCPYWEVAKAFLTNLESRATEDPTPPDQRFFEELQTKIAKGKPLNPSHYFWETLITEFNCPFIKRELVQLNPVEVVSAWRWAEVVGNIEGFDIGLIKRHLQTL